MNIYDTIAAISTPLGEGGIGIVRISGEKAEEVMTEIFQPRFEKFPLKSHRLYLGNIINPDNKEKIDEVLVSFMKKPHTFTREDVVEINCHGGIVPLKQILAVVLARGVRLAERGEFTRRAFLNGRLDLAQAEGLLQIIRAKTETGLKAALNQLEGSLSGKVKEIRREILLIIAHLEAAIDFPEEDLVELEPEGIKSQAKALADKLANLLKESERGRIYREGVETAIIGRPNVGKSSLLNALLREERAIVTEVPGTTRDQLIEYVNIKGIPLKLVDTAGIRETGDRVERIGVERARHAAVESDIVLFVLDASEPLKEEDRQLAASLGDKQGIIVLNKIDLGEKIKEKDVAGWLANQKIVRTALIYGEGINSLEEAVAELVLSGTMEVERSTFLASMRQKQCLERAQKHLQEVVEGDFTAPELLAVDLYEAYNALGEITGENIGEDVLDTIFAEFCIGK
ncbi:MAG TPA: tRNA uridine-5-carboxymethylaminomethyl(34) synthesis GTPase MnmE [Firmicutes bacterium]|nr:tRNA uridine-5-carboxymethylaminomethyl(34) synthesis GTPase MnmE [Bacillota bacterium]